jgi:hypothetical protein
MSEPTCKSIRIEFSDGTFLTSYNSGHAEDIWEWWRSCETLAIIHGAVYKSRPLVSNKVVVDKL